MKRDWKSLFPLNHYDWLFENLPTFFSNLGFSCPSGLIVAHGDKCSTYRSAFEEAGIPFPHGVAIYLLSYCSPFSNEVRETENGWVDPEKWVIKNYSRFKEFLPPVLEG